MPMIEKEVPAPELIGTKGYPLHWKALGLPMPTKKVVVEVDENGNEVGTPTDVPTDLKAYAAHRRWLKEVGGTVWNGWPVHTDRESQAKIIAERLAIAEGERDDPDGWKFADGVFRMISNADFIALSNAVREHVRRCFTLEGMALAGIASGDITTPEDVDALFASE
jgi:hypothetical protein